MAWTRREWGALALGVVAAVLIRIVLLPTQGVRDDTDQFAGWVHTIATGGFTGLYGDNPFGPVTFGPVMAYIWAFLGAVQPMFTTATDAADPAIRIALKLPASLADLGLAALAAYALRDRPGLAVTAAVAVLLAPPIWYISAWWGQYESIFVLSALAAVVAAADRRNIIAAALIAVSLMTKPQALALVVPFAAWFWATGYGRDGVRGALRELARTAVTGLVVIVILWIPFIPEGGPAGYLANLATYQNDVFNILSLRAWNAWWLVQEAAVGGSFIADDVPFLGPLTLRHVGYAVTGVLSALIAVAIVRDPRPRTLVAGLAASVLVFFSFMTQMHERYAYASLVFLVLLVAEPRMRSLAVVVAIVFLLNLVAAFPPTPAIGDLVPVQGLWGVVGSLVFVAVTIVCVRAVVSRSRAEATAT